MSHVVCDVVERCRTLSSLQALTLGSLLISTFPSGIYNVRFLFSSDVGGGGALYLESRWLHPHPEQLTLDTLAAARITEDSQAFDVRDHLPVAGRCRLVNSDIIIRVLPQRHR